MSAHGHSRDILRQGIIANNPAWVQLLGLCPLLAVSNSVANALGLAAASLFVLLGANTSIALLRHTIPLYARLPCFVLVIATFTTAAVMLLEAYAYPLYVEIALFVQIIVTNCMILGRVEAFAARQPVGRAVVDALATGIGFAIALIALGAVREVIGNGTLLAGVVGEGLQLTENRLPLARLAPGAFIIAGVLLALGIWVLRSPSRGSHEQS